jgi:fermentation-respiration switch protein FrsA (DUF1100 family)
MRTWKLIGLGLLVGLLLFLVGSWLAGSAFSAPARQVIGSMPSDLHGRAIEFHSDSGATIHGWLLPGRPGAGAIALMHGVRANRLSMVDRARFLSAAGFSVLLFDFQAHGESTGERITFGYLESKDAEGAVKFLHENAPGERVGVIGVSMGGAAATLASPPLEVDAMVVEMVYPTINEAITDRLSARLGGWAGVLSPGLSWQLKPRMGIGVNDLRPIDHVGEITAPKLFIAGAEDRYTRIDESRRIYEAAAKPKELWIVPGAGHQDLYQFATTEYKGYTWVFFSKFLSTKP